MQQLHLIKLVLGTVVIFFDWCKHSLLHDCAEDCNSMTWMSLNCRDHFAFFQCVVLQIPDCSLSSRSRSMLLIPGNLSTLLTTYGYRRNPTIFTLNMIVVELLVVFRICSAYLMLLLKILILPLGSSVQMNLFHHNSWH